MPTGHYFSHKKITSMKKIYALQRTRKLIQHSFLLLLLFSLFAGKITAQTYVNGNLSTGATTSTGTTAPAGFTWSELQLTNTTLGFGASIAGGLTVADDFTVPAGPSWTVSKVTFYAYSTGYTGTTSPFTDVRVQIYDTDPSTGTPTPIFGDLTTNRFAASSTASIYRTAAAGGTTRQVWQIEANVSTILAPGTYWIEWQVGTSQTSNFSPPSTVVGSTTQPGNNAKQKTISTGAWAPLNDGGSGTAQDMPFKIDYSTGACSGTPNPGNTLSSVASACPGVSFTLSLQNATTGSGISYQWQSASTLAGPYSNIAGATSSSYTTTLTGDTYYQCVVTCSGNPGTSAPVLVALTPSSGCYCVAGSTDVDPNFEKIDRVEFGTLDNSSTSFAGYENFTNLTPVADFEAGSSVPITITGNANTYGGDKVRVWIDYNHNGNFTDAGELVYESGQSAGPYTSTVVFPASASSGTTRMRIRLYDDIFGNGVVGPCGSNTYGQVEDYTINITPCRRAVINAQPVNATSYCSGNATFSINASGTALAYQWQVRSNSSALWTIISNGGVYSGQGTATLTLTDLTSTYNGYQYQVAITGPCTPTVLSSVATLTVGPLVANVTPASATICNGSTQQLSITTTAPPTVASFNSGAISVAIPEGTFPGPYVGGTSTIPVSGIPGTAIITKVSVKLNVTHAYVGDIVAVLKAPNGNIINLDAMLNATNNPGNNFVNTVISSDGVTRLDAGTEPFTGVFAADLVGATFDFFGFPVPGGPVGYEPTNQDWPSLYSVPNGNWTLAFYDAGAPDVGNLTSWSIDITYGAPFSGIWSPATGLSTDAAGTIPYVAGSLANTVYATPTTSTDYSVTISTPNCTSNPTVIPVTVANPVGTITAPTDMTICVNTNASFTVSAASGNPITYRWQVSTDNGTTWSNITNGGTYNGATTATLNITGAPSSYNGYKYRAVLSVAACSNSANSGAATLTVNDLPTVILAAAPYTELYPGISTTVSASVSPNAATYQWYLNGVLIPGATGSSIPVDVDGFGDYTVTVTDINGCTNTSASKTISEKANDVLFIYPSPNTGQFQVRYYNLKGNSINPRILNIYDSKGARVYSKTYSLTEPYSKMAVDMSHYSSGIYRVELSDRNGKRIKTGSVIIL